MNPHLAAFAHFIYEHRASAVATFSLVFTAFLYNSPASVEEFSAAGTYTWIRNSLFAIFNVRHPQPLVQPVEAALVPKQ